MNTDAPDPLSAPLSERSHHDTDRSPPPVAAPPAIDLERRIKLLAAERYDVLLDGLRERCAAALNGWLDAHPAVSIDEDGVRLRDVAPDEIVVQRDRGHERYAYVRRSGAFELEELGPGIMCTSAAEALLVLTAWAELDRGEVRS